MWGFGYIPFCTTYLNFHPVSFTVRSENYLSSHSMLKYFLNETQPSTIKKRTPPPIILFSCLFVFIYIFPFSLITLSTFWSCIFWSHIFKYYSWFIFLTKGFIDVLFFAYCKAQWGHWNITVENRKHSSTNAIVTKPWTIGKYIAHNRNLHAISGTIWDQWKR